MFSLSKENIKSAIVYVIVTTLVAILLYILKVGSLFKINLHDLIDSGFMALTVGVSSLLKNLFTDNTGKFLYITKVIPENSDTSEK